MLRGMTRMLVGTVVLALSAWIGALVWQQAPALSFQWFGKSVGLINTGLPIFAFVASFIFIRKIAKAVANPFAKSTTDEIAGPPSTIRLVFRLMLAPHPGCTHLPDRRHIHPPHRLDRRSQGLRGEVPRQGKRQSRQLQPEPQIVDRSDPA